VDDAEDCTHANEVVRRDLAAFRMGRKNSGPIGDEVHGEVGLWGLAG
jgi:hypothetical protein